MALGVWRSTLIFLAFTNQIRRILSATSHALLRRRCQFAHFFSYLCSSVYAPPFFLDLCDSVHALSFFSDLCDSARDLPFVLQLRPPLTLGDSISVQLVLSFSFLLLLRVFSVFFLIFVKVFSRFIFLFSLFLKQFNEFYFNKLNEFIMLLDFE